MAENSGLDPFGLWREMVTQWERGLNNVANQTMGSDEFSRAMHQVTSLGLRIQQTAGEAMGKSLQAMNLPTRDDLLAINERIGRLEESLARVEAALGATNGAAKAGPDAGPKPPRTRQPPAT